MLVFIRLNSAGRYYAHTAIISEVHTTLTSKFHTALVRKVVAMLASKIHTTLISIIHAIFTRKSPHYRREVNVVHSR